MLLLGAYATFRARLDLAWIEEALATTGTATLRKRRFLAEQVVWLVIGMALCATSPARARCASRPILGRAALGSAGLLLDRPWLRVPRDRLLASSESPCVCTAGGGSLLSQGGQYQCRATLPTRASSRNQRWQIEHGRFFRTAPARIADRPHPSMGHFSRAGPGQFSSTVGIAN
ncbi:MAG TPA: transposase domain-containing protein [Kofleriaceae bacterium]|nr:transposase domain-containing protein [Kofleriaceae bacterium]